MCVWATYVWKPGAWVICSVTCGQGVQHRALNCATLEDTSAITIPTGKQLIEKCQQNGKKMPLDIKPCKQDPCRNIFLFV